MLNKIENLKRIRFTSPHPKDFKIDTLKTVNNLDKVTNQIHIPLQSGSTEILRRMQRGYNQEKFINKVDLVKKYINNVSLTTDVIVGFPGETESDFNETLKILKYAEFDAVYMFKFSPRPGTKASEYKEKFIDNETIKNRFLMLKEIQTEISHRRYKRFIGTEQHLLVENYSKKTSEFMSGKIDGGQTTHVPSAHVNIGDYVRVMINDATPFALKGTLI